MTYMAHPVVSWVNIEGGHCTRLPVGLTPLGIEFDSRALRILLGLPLLKQSLELGVPDAALIFPQFI